MTMKDVNKLMVAILSTLEGAQLGEAGAPIDGYFLLVLNKSLVGDHVRASSTDEHEESVDLGAHRSGCCQVAK